MATPKAYRLHLHLPGLTPLNPSDRKSFWVMHKAKKRWENEVWIAVLRAGGPPRIPLAKSWVMIVRHSSTEPDYDNLVHGGKFLVDALMKSGVIINDKPTNFIGGHPDYVWVKTKTGEGHITIDVEEPCEECEERRRGDGLAVCPGCFDAQEDPE